MGTRFPIALLVSALLALSGCGGSPTPDPGGSGGGGGGSGGGGGGGGGEPPPTVTALYVASAEEAETYNTSFRPAVISLATDPMWSGSRMAFANLPDSGSMDYAGFLELVISSATASANVAAPATLTLTLDDLALSGAASGFMGAAFDENLEERLVNYAGTILISNGRVSAGTGGFAAVTLDIDGSLDSGLHIFGVDGTLVGFLYGAEGYGLRARGTSSGLSGSMVTTVDGTPGLLGVGTLSMQVQPTPP